MLLIQSLPPGKCGIGTEPAPCCLTPKSGQARLSFSKLPLGAEEAPKGPHAQGTRLNRAGAIAPQGLVPSPKQRAGQLSHRLGPASAGARESRQVELSVCAAALLRSLLPFAFPETGSWCQSRPWAGRAPQPWPCARSCSSPSGTRSPHWTWKRAARSPSPSSR